MRAWLGVRARRRSRRPRPGRGAGTHPPRSRPPGAPCRPRPRIRPLAGGGPGAAGRPGRRPPRWSGLRRGEPRGEPGATRSRALEGRSGQARTAGERGLPEQPPTIPEVEGMAEGRVDVLPARGRPIHEDARPGGVRRRRAPGHHPVGGLHRRRRMLGPMDEGWMVDRGVDEEDGVEEPAVGSTAVLRRRSWLAPTTRPTTVGAPGARAAAQRPAQRCRSCRTPARARARSAR